MEHSSRVRLARLGSGESIPSICASEKVTRAEFDAWWAREAAARVPDPTGARRAAVVARVHIDRDGWGIPHIRAESDADLFFGFGYAMAADRLFQMDYLRRKASGRLAEVIGQEGLELDVLARTVGLRRIAESEWETIPNEPRRLLAAFSAGVNSLIDESRDTPPIEFDLLGYRPEPWSPIDCLAIEVEFRWYLTGRFPVIVMPELAKRALGEGPLYRAFLQRESDEESIAPAGSYIPRQAGSQPAGVSAGDPGAGQGSNNWVIGGARTTSGAPVVASDPHIAFEAVSCWYEAHLDGGSFTVAGMTYVGIPAVMFGRNRRVAWGCTNNICSLRDLYQERTSPAHPDCFLHDSRWEPAGRREELIAVKGAEPVRLEVRSSRNGPIVDEVLPGPARKTGPVALKWLGALHGGWLTALLGMNRADSAAAFREATRPWHVPTFTLVFADVAGSIGCQVTGRIPLRDIPERGYRPGWDPAHQWKGLIPFEGMPSLINPARGWIASANNRTAPDDYLYPLAGTWADDLRARRIRQMIEACPQLSHDGCMAMQRDTLSLRAEASIPPLLALLAGSTDARMREGFGYLEQWDRRVEPDRVGAALFNAFFARWAKTVAGARLDGETIDFLVGGLNGLAASLLTEDPSEWFAEGARERAIQDSFRATLDELSARLGPDMSQWTWGRLHTLTLRHVLSNRGELSQLLDRGGVAVAGDFVTVFNTGMGPNLDAKTGAGYRVVAELGPGPQGLWASDLQSQSGHPGSAHYDDQLGEWLRGGYHWLPLDPLEEPKVTLVLEPLVD
jgi:penicillin amidase